MTSETPIDLLTKAVGDITAALMLAGMKDSVADWTAPYVVAINEADARLAHRGGEVVAYVWTDPTHQRPPELHWHYDMGPPYEGWIATPLYAAPPTDEVARLREAANELLSAQDAIDNWRGVNEGPPWIRTLQRRQAALLALSQALGDIP